MKLLVKVFHNFLIALKTVRFVEEIYWAYNLYFTKSSCYNYLSQWKLQWLDGCLKIVEYQISRKFVQWYLSCYMFTDKQMDSDFNRLCSSVITPKAHSYWICITVKWYQQIYYVQITCFPKVFYRFSSKLFPPVSMCMYENLMLV